MKHYEIIYRKDSRSAPKTVIAKTLDEKYEILNKCEASGYEVEGVREFDPTPIEERFYA